LAEKGVPSEVSSSLTYGRTCSAEKGNLMASPTPLRTPYIERLELVSDTIRAHSKLNEKSANELAVYVLLALNSIPEKMR
jgi:uncharacterized protein DUF6307